MSKEITDSIEIINPGNSRYDFSIFRPGGNDTCLVVVNQSMPMPEERKRINDVMQEVYPNVEQVGFVKLDPTCPELMMAGGEFCGNATRSTAWQCLAGQPGEVSIKVSGVEQRLRAGVSSDGEAFAQMPVYKDPSRITQDSQTGFIVQMEGITHYVDFDSTATTGLTQEEIKKKAMQTINEKDLDQYPASGVIYVSQDGNSMKIDPVVYVRDINTLYYETACGSGTTALGLVTALLNGKSLDELSVMQPSGMPIKISVDFNGNSFQYAQIKGNIETLNTGVLEIGERAIVAEQIDTLQKLQEALSNGNLTALYKDIFSKAPYYEQFSDELVEEIFMEYVQDGLLFVTKKGKEVIGFGGSVPLSLTREIADILQFTRDETDISWYIADVGVKDTDRRKGIARTLNNAQLRLLPAGTTAVMRTSELNILSQKLFLSLGFQQISGAFQEVENSRTDGEIKKDKRIFMKKQL